MSKLWVLLSIVAAVGIFAAMYYAGLFHPSDRADESQLVVYTGRSRNLVQPIVDRFEQKTGIKVHIRYDSDMQLLAMLQEERDAGRPSADIVWLNTAGALGAANNAELLADLPERMLARPIGFVPSSGRWVPGTVRFRVLAYNPQRVSADQLPATVMDLARLERFSGRIGWTPNYSSFHDFLTALRLEHGPEVTLQWLRQMISLEPKSYNGNTAMLQALADGEIDLAFTNHYYVERLRQQHGPDAVAMHHFDSGDVGNLALVTGAGLLRTTQRPRTGHTFLAFLLEEEAQQYAASNLNEYPVTSGVELPDNMLPMDRVQTLSPAIDFEQLRDLDATLELLRQAGLH